MMEVTKQYQIKNSNRFAALENLNDSEEKTGLGKTLKRISEPQLKRIQVCKN